ncbi:MAG TPA: hypothetical protein PLN69_05030 [bacterium]|nr:hypothetical protein [bacterium]
MKSWDRQETGIEDKVFCGLSVLPECPLRRALSRAEVVRVVWRDRQSGRHRAGDGDGCDIITALAGMWEPGGKAGRL